MAYNNTFAFVTVDPYGILLTSGCDNSIIRNNIVYSCNIYNLGSGNTFSNNLTSNPLFQNDGGSYLLDTDYRIQSTSSAINYGVDISLTEDYEGNAIAGLPDAGAFEYVADIPPVEPVVVFTTSVVAGTTTATSGGNVTDDGGGTVTARGVCWAYTANPVITDSHTSDGSGAGTYVSYISPLIPNTTYHARAYATNETGTAYGDDVEFTTISGAGLDGDVVFINGLILIYDNKIVIKIR